MEIALSLTIKEKTEPLENIEVGFSGPDHPYIVIFSKRIDRIYGVYLFRMNREEKNNRIRIAVKVNGKEVKI